MRATGHAHPVGSGENAHEWAHQLSALVDLEGVDGRPLTITVPEPLTAHGQRLVDSLGVRVEVGRLNDALVEAAEPVVWSRDETLLHLRRMREVIAENRALLPEPPAAFRERVERELAEARGQRASAAEPEAKPEDAAKTKRHYSRWTTESAVARVREVAELLGRPPMQREATEYDLPAPPTARALFGSWAGMIEAAGFPRPTRGRVKRAPAVAATTSEERAARRTVGAGRGARSSDADLTAVRTRVLEAVSALFALLDEVEARAKAARP